MQTRPDLSSDAFGNEDEPNASGLAQEARRDFPRVLVLAQNRIQPYTGGGVVLSNLFGEFPAEKLIFLHRDIDYDFEIPYPEERLRAFIVRPRARLPFQCDAYLAAETVLADHCRDVCQALHLTQPCLEHR